MRSVMRGSWLLLVVLLAVAWTARARHADPATAAAPLDALPELHNGVAAKHPGDRGIGDDPAVLFHDDFESGHPRERWDNLFQEEHVRVTDEPANVAHGKRAVEFTVPKQDRELSNALVKKLGDGHDAVFLRYYSKFGDGFDAIGSSHNGGHLSALAPGVPYATPGTKADGRNKFSANFENWRGDAATPAPGELNVYCYHPAQRTQWGDHFFPSGKVLPWTYKPGDFGPHFVARPEVVPEPGRWYCYEFMLRANAPGRRDGRIACWVDGKLIADFPNLRLRDVDALKVNHAAIDLHIGSNPNRENKKWYDDVVIATAYVGPVAPTK